MATHEYWQFAFVREIGDGTKAVPRIGHLSPLKVEMSNLPKDSAPNEEYPNELVTGDHLRVLYSLPSDISVGQLPFTLTGKIRILKKTKEFPRGYQDGTATLVLEEDLSSDLVNVERDTYFFHLDHDTSNSKVVWYYTVFYEVLETATSNTYWVFSPINGHDRGFALSHADSKFGDQMFKYFPRGIRIRDKSEANDTLYRLCQILGKPLDEIKERLDQFSEKRFDPNTVDASLIPYIDQLLGWPTNFELGELRRRKETNNAIDLWKAKGTNNAFELALQELTGWDVELIEGYNHVITTATADDFLDANNPPNGWDEQVDGVWADQVNQVPFNGTPDLSNPTQVYQEGDRNSPFRIIFNNDNWQNLYGVLVQLVSPLSDGSPLLNKLAQEKIERLLTYLAVHYANFKVQVAEVYTESLSINTLDSFSDDYVRGVDEDGQLIVDEIVSHATNTGVMYTYPHPDSEQSANNVIWSSTLSGNAGRLFHNVLNLG